jgi:transposase
MNGSQSDTASFHQTSPISAQQDRFELLSSKGTWLTEQELTQLKREKAFWKALHGRAVEREKNLKNELKEAKAKIRDLQHRLFGKNTEKGSSKKPEKKKNESDRPRGQQTGSKGHGRTQRPHLPEIPEVHDLPDEEKYCSTCGGAYLPFPGTEDSSIFEIEVSAHTRRIRRKRYTPGCQCPNRPGIITAPPAPRLFSRNPYGVSIWVEILLDKYLYSRPTHRLCRHLSTLGLPISQGTITGGLKRLEPLIEPLVTTMHEKQMTEPLFHSDETRWMVFETIEGKIGHRWFLWITQSESVEYFHVAPGRGADVPIGHFGQLPEKVDSAILVCDRYSAYKCLAKNIDIIILAFCWAHVRRDFLDEARSYPEQEKWMLTWVEQIGELYHINKQRLIHWDKDLPVSRQSPAFNKNHKQLVQAIDAMQVRRDKYLNQEKLPAPQKSVLSSMKNHWAGLTVFVQHPEVPMDNNRAERGLRTPVSGRKNYYGSGSKWSASLMAGMLTLLQTVIHWGINPRHWLTALLTACAENGGKLPEDLSPFLPWSMDEKQKQRLSKPLPAAIPDISAIPDTS